MSIAASTALESTPTFGESLNAAQRRAALYGSRSADGFTAGPLLIIAGAGTGKTNTLAHRVAHLLLQGVTPERILLLTFTRRAAQEMLRRAERIATQALSDSPQAGAIHINAARLFDGSRWTFRRHELENRKMRFSRRGLFPSHGSGREAAVWLNEPGSVKIIVR